MPVERQRVSYSMFCGLLEIEPSRLVGVDVDRVTRIVTLILEPAMVQVSGTFPQLTTKLNPGGKKTGGKGKGKRG